MAKVHQISPDLNVMSNHCLTGCYTRTQKLGDIRRSHSHQFPTRQCARVCCFAWKCRLVARDTTFFFAWVVFSILNLRDVAQANLGAHIFQSTKKSRNKDQKLTSTKVQHMNPSRGLSWFHSTKRYQMTS